MHLACSSLEQAGSLDSLMHEVSEAHLIGAWRSFVHVIYLGPEHRVSGGEKLFNFFSSLFKLLNEQRIFFIAIL